MAFRFRTLSTMRVRAPRHTTTKKAPLDFSTWGRWQNTGSRQCVQQHSKSVANILDVMIKHDRANRLILFYASLLTFTEEDQINIIMSGESAGGKSYLPQKVCDYFPSALSKQSRQHLLEHSYEKENMGIGVCLFSLTCNS